MGRFIYKHLLKKIMKKYISSIVGSVLVIVAIVSIGAIAKADNTAISSPSSYLWDGNRANDDILQLYNLRVSSVQNSPTTGLPVVITALANQDFACLKYDTESSQAYHPCFINLTNKVYNLRVASDTILLLNNRMRMDVGQVMIGDRLNVFGFREESTNGVEALIIRDLSKPSVTNLVQINNVTVTGISSPFLPATVTVFGNGTTQNINVSSTTVIWNQNNVSVPFSSLALGDMLSISGYQQGSVISAYSIRDLGSVAVNPAPTITSISGPTSLRVGQAGVWTLAANDSLAGYITYSVRFGDEVNYATNPGATIATPSNDSTASFSHAYNATGIYTLTFSAANSSNQVTNTTLTVNIIS